MDLTYFRTFQEVARLRSFTRAGERLGYAQSSVTMQIQKLERAYGVPLIERHGRQLRLTPPGEELLKLASAMLELYEQSLETVGAGQACGGSLNIVTTDSVAAYYLPPYLQQLKERIPGVGIRLHTASEAALTAGVREGLYDIGLLLDTGPPDPDLKSAAIRAEPLILAAAPGHPLAGLASIQPSGLDGVELVVSEEGCVYRDWFQTWLRSQGVTCPTGLELGSLEAVKRCVRSGLGAALLPEMVAEGELAAGQLVRIPLDPAPRPLELRYLLHPKKWISASLQTLLSLLTEQS